MLRLDEVNNLNEAASYYHNLNLNKKLKHAGIIKPRYEKLAPKYFERTHDIGDKGNDYDMLIQKQEKRDYESTSAIAQVLKEEGVNSLGITDSFYHVVIYRKKWISRWGNNIENSKYRDSPGIYIPYRIIEYIQNNKIQNQSQFVLIMADKSIHVAPCNEVIDSIFKLKIKAFINQWSQLCCGADKGWFKIEK